MKHPSHYRTLALSLVISFFTMYGAMFLNVDSTDHIRLSLTRAYMSLLMVAPMAVTMLLLMWPMFENKARNYLILAGSAVLFVVGLALHGSIEEGIQRIASLIRPVATGEVPPAASAGDAGSHSSIRLPDRASIRAVAAAKAMPSRLRSASSAGDASVPAGA